MILTSRNNPLIKEMAALKEKKGRKEQGFFLAEGVKMVSECKRSGLEIGRTFVSESYRGETDENAICVSDEVFAFLSDEKTPQGILCSVRIPKPSLCPPKESCLLLDGVSDRGASRPDQRRAIAVDLRQGAQRPLLQRDILRLIQHRSRETM